MLIATSWWVVSEASDILFEQCHTHYTMHLLVTSAAVCCLLFLYTKCTKQLHNSESFLLAVPYVSYPKMPNGFFKKNSGIFCLHREFSGEFWFLSVIYDP